MPRNAQDVTDAELAVLKVLWRTPSATIREITDELYPRRTDSDYATVKKLLARLEKKRFVQRNRNQMAHTFRATLSLDDLLGRRLEVIANNLCDGSPTPLLMHLIRTDGITKKQQQQLRELIQEIAAKQNRRKHDKNSGLDL